MNDPCRLCYLYPRNCPAMCTSKMKYVNEVDGDTPVVIRNNKKNRKSHVFYERGKKYEYNKNGIRREIR